MNRKIRIGDKREPIFGLWLEHRRRRQFAGVAFEPDSCAADIYNFWQGFIKRTRPDATCALFIAHLREQVCRGEEPLFRWLIEWLAHMVQRPGEIPGTAVVLRGGRGVGKSIVGQYVGAMCPAHHVTIAQQDHLLGKFNAHLKYALLIQTEEGFWAGNKSLEGPLKDLITNSERMLEAKYLNAYPVKNCARVLITSNEAYVVPAGPDERRFAVFDVGDARRQDHAYFGAIVQELKAGGAEALLDHLRNVDLSKANVRRAPETQGLLAQKIAALESMPQWLYGCLQEGAIDASGEWPERLSIKTMHDRYVDAVGKDRHARILKSAQFGQKLFEILPSVGKTRPSSEPPRVWHYDLPSLEVSRAEFGMWIGSAVPWEGQ